ncbi:hypothetical protein N7495_001602 [Penicillium taxi]|uniref:uncharacterized protein n=1 Tax=Penicillium taxi TaxID=168475 RepID=UPI00254598DA|nr:uncharacterized protein N7495_001602 [Penicillium taxi]KAJ5908920.1 hypothetical protein N7495_001602 [Penicillium taxi]
MTDHLPRYHQNTLTLLPINTATLSKSLEELRFAVRNGADLISSNDSIHGQWESGGIFKHFPGIALAFLRLDYQSSVLEGEKGSSRDYRHLALQRVPPGIPDIPLLPSRLSPMGSSSPVTAVVLRMLAAVARNRGEDDLNTRLSQHDITCLHDATSLALKNGPIVPHNGRNMGGDEILFGRAGLLWTLINIRAHQFDEETQRSLTPVLDLIPELVRVIIDAGRQGSKDYAEKNGSDDAHPLMYAWVEGYYGFGAAHGITGILPAILACKPEEISDFLPVIGDTITALCKLCIASNGHLPMSFPKFGAGGRPEFVQFCHGSPGLLLLVATALNSPLLLDHWCPEWDQAIDLATARIWEEGILSKGGGLCHGIAGNAWPWLILHDFFEYHSKDIDEARYRYFQRIGTAEAPDAGYLTSDFFLSKALAFMLHSRETRPYNITPVSPERDFRMPDDPYCLFEGLAGTVCAWAETCGVLQARLRKLELPEGELENDVSFQTARRAELGFPFIGGNGVVGMF